MPSAILGMTMVNTAQIRVSATPTVTLRRFTKLARCASRLALRRREGFCFSPCPISFAGSCEHSELFASCSRSIHYRNSSIFTVASRDLSISLRSSEHSISTLYLYKLPLCSRALKQNHDQRENVWYSLVPRLLPLNKSLGIIHSKICDNNNELN